MPEPGAPPSSPPRRPTIRFIHDYSIIDSEYQGLAPLGRPIFDKFGAQAEDLYELYGVLIDWLKTPYIKDDCEDHDERIRWLETMDQERRAEMKRNKLALNSIIPIYHTFDLIPRLLKAAGQEALIPPGAYPDYQQDMVLLKGDSLPLKQRIAMTQKWERSAKQIVDALETFVQSEKKAATG